MSERLIPNGDPEFLTKLRAFAHTIAKDPPRFSLSGDDAAAMMNAFQRFEQASDQSRFGGGRSDGGSRVKKEARADAARLYKRLVNIIKISETVDVEARINAGLRTGDGKRRARTCPQEPPDLRFMRALHVGSAMAPMHELRFKAVGAYSKAKPPGAARLELFVDLVPPGENVPDYPGENFASRPWYLRSYSRTPIRLAPPICRLPMLVVYWGRWADAVGNVGPFCSTVVSRIEGWTGQAVGPTMFNGPKPVRILEDPSGDAGPGPATREQKYRITVLQAQCEYFHPRHVPLPSALPQDHTRETRKLEGPVENEAA
jgi:hypothetical protein